MKNANCTDFCGNTFHSDAVPLWNVAYIHPFSGSYCDINGLLHGHDEALREQVKSFLKDQGIEPVILSECASSGKTIIEKLESESDGVKYAIILYTPDDNSNTKNKKRARQNVIFEHGYFTAKLGRQNVCVIMSDNVEKVGDNDGVVYVPRDNWKIGLMRELKDAGFEVDANAIL